MTSAQDRREFRGYLKSCSDRQVQGVYDKERAAGRDEYAELAIAEAERRGIALVGEFGGTSDIRSYGPGKFYTILDSYIYKMTLDGGADEEAGYEEGGGWYGLVHLAGAVKRLQEIAAENHDKLTRDEIKELRNNVGVILFERSDGTVESAWYDSKKKLAADWKQVEEDVREGSEDY